MRNLPLPSREEDRSDLELALTQHRYRDEVKGYHATEEEVIALLAIYDHYDETFGAPSDAKKGPALGTDVKDALHSAFGFVYEGRRLKHLRQNLLKGVDRCPMCGIFPAKELDHFLPRSVYKPLAIYARNLVPLCHACNNIKSDRGAGQLADQFVHAYFDILPDIDFIIATIALDGEALSFGFHVAEGDGLTTPLAAKLTYQLDTLDLEKRFSTELNTYLSSLAPALEMVWEYGGTEDVKTYLAKQIVMETKTHHRNDWRVATLKALRLDQDFCAGGFRAVFATPDAMKDEIDELVTA
ncbi:HNH endonuclease signature motif containing protein [Rhizobium sp. L245/93]|uniref:HNH endonuclease n=1 Tax=Rhizobium sp. L245/93 TaxID=2819998 RepID=UPI001ADA9589|nr:HNH endonuclease signature motif containing protein [Rhizobium sp. L245/93]MBO9170030.1 HNH endonuclease [Rhizobium sp. L245/93]